MRALATENDAICLGLSVISMLCSSIRYDMARSTNAKIVARIL